MAQMCVQRFKVQQVTAAVDYLELVATVAKQHHSQQLIRVGFIDIPQCNAGCAIAKSLANRSRNFHWT
jgi:hypothetical protein